VNTQIICDACCNHGGERFLMQKYIEKAAEIGCDYIKFQLFDAEKLNKGWDNYENAKKHYKQCELSHNDIMFIVEHCFINDIKLLFTAFDLESANSLTMYNGIKRVKIASPDCNNWELIDFCIDNFKNVFISLGMHYGYEIKKLLQKYKQSIIPMYCRSLYPLEVYTSDDYLAMKYLQSNFDVWGISDHSRNIDNLFHAMKEYQPNYIERHFTLEKTSKKDDIVSSTPEDMARLTGYPFPALSDEEIKNRKYIRRWKNEY